MGKSHFIRNASIAILVLGVALVGINSLNKPIKLDANKSEKNSSDVIVDSKNSIKETQSHFEENSTLEKKYKSVAMEIEEFIKKQKMFKSKVVKIDETNKTIDEDLKKIVKVETNITKPKIIEEKKVVVTKKYSVKKVIKKSNSLPKLAIIMDDVGFFGDVEKIKKVPFPITPSIFPPNDYFLDTPDIAKKFKHYMVHFPMEAYKYKNINEVAIKVSDTVEVIDKKIRRMQKNFPKAIAINNHTGSKYTCDFDAMEEFFTVLNKYGINFIDSRTSSGTQCQEVGKLLNKKVLERNVFLDNRADVTYIENQLKEAVKIAKKNGYAIAICHPREMTFEVLMSCSDIIKDVEVVYINELL